MEKIQQIFQKELNEGITRISDVSRGVSQIVKIVETKKSTYILKIPKKDKEKLIKREVLAYEKLKNLIPVPKIIAKTNKKNILRVS